MSNNKLLTVWSAHLKTKEQREKFNEAVVSFLNSKPGERLQQIVHSRMEALDRPSFEEYDSPSWAYKQAHLNGYRQALEEIVQLLTTNKD